MNEDNENINSLGIDIITEELEIPQSKGSAKEKESAWYVVYTMGHEDKVRQQILTRAENMGAKERIMEIYIPKKTVTKIKGGKRIEKEMTHYQRYIFVNMILDDDTFRVVRNTPGVLSIIDKPLSQIEVARLFGRKKKKFSEVENTSEYVVDFSEGDEVKIEGGAFDGFTGKAGSIDVEHGKVTVLVSVFGRQTPVDLTIDQVHSVASY